MSRKDKKIMKSRKNAIEQGDRVKVCTKEGEEYEGTLFRITLGIYADDPTQASIILSEDESENMTYGQVHIFCDDLKTIEKEKNMEELEKNERLSKKEKTVLFLKSILEALFDIFLVVVTIAFCVGVLFLCKLAITTNIFILPIIIALIIFCWYVRKVYIDNVYDELAKRTVKEYKQKMREKERQEREVNETT